MKPIIFVVGVSNSLTSMVIKFLLNNGAYGGEFSPERDGKYPRWENKELKMFEDGHGIVRFVEYLQTLPEDKVCALKGSITAYWIRLFKVNREIKIVYVLRNPANTIASNLEKGTGNFIRFFQRYCDFYRLMTYPGDVLPFMAERIWYDYKRLLEFCELPTDVVTFNDIQQFKKRNFKYIQHRFSNFWWKRLNAFFKIEKVA